MSQPALSRAIQQLEAELGGELFRRERSLTHMTDLGRAVFPALNDSYEAAVNAKSLAQAFLKHGHAPLHLALSPAFELELIAPLLSEVAEAFPQVEIKIFRGAPQDIAERLKSGDDEIAITGALDESWDRLNVKKLFEQRFALLMHLDHSLSARDHIEMSDLTNERLLCQPHCTMAEELEQRLRAIGGKIMAKHEVPAIDDMAGLARARFGIGVWPTFRRLDEDLALRNLNGINMSRAIHVYTVAGRRHSPAASALINLLRVRDWSEVVSDVVQAEGAVH